MPRLDALQKAVMTERGYMTVLAAAQRLGLNYQRLYRWTLTGKVPCLDVEGFRFIARSDVDRLAELKAADPEAFVESPKSGAKPVGFPNYAERVAMANQGYITSGAFAEIAGVSRHTVYRWIAQGKIHSTTVGSVRYALERDAYTIASERRSLGIVPCSDPKGTSYRKATQEQRELDRNSRDYGKLARIVERIGES